jgi:uncharacterized protein involved in outer membrane biogenesis
MKRTLIWIILPVSVLVLLVGSLTVLPFLVDLSRVKIPIQAEVSRHLNVTLEFSSARLTIVPSLGIRLSDVVITNSTGPFAGTKLLTVRKASFQADLESLKRGLLTGDFEVSHPELLIVSQGNENNIQNLFRTKSGNAHPNGSPSPKTGTTAETPWSLDALVATLHLRELVLHEATIALQARGAATQSRISNLEIVLREPTVNSDFQVELSTDADIRERHLEAQGGFLFKGTVRLNADGSNISALSTNGTIDASNTRFLILNRLEKPEHQPCQLGIKTETRFPGSEPGLWWNGTAGTLNLTCDTARFRDIPIQKLTGTIELSKGRVTTDNLNLSLLGGRATVHAASEPFAEPPSHQLNIRYEKLRVEQALLAFKPNHKPVLEGDLKGDFTIRGTGGSGRELLANSEGTGEFVLSDGRLLSENANAILQREFDRLVEALPFQKKQTLFETETLNDTKLQPVNGSLRYAEERLHVKARHLDKRSNEALLDFFLTTDSRISGGARYTLAEESRNKLIEKSKHLRMLLDPKKELVFRVTLGGTISAPQALLDFSFIKIPLKKNSRQILEQKLRQLLGR